MSYIYTICCEDNNELSSAVDIMWNQSYPTLETAQQSIIEDLTNIREDEEVFGELPQFKKASIRSNCWILDDDEGCARTWTIMQTEVIT